MSTTKFLRAGLIASVGVAGLTLTANAQSRYGNVYDYESGRNCGQACVAPAPQTPQANTRYGAPVVAAPTYNQAPVYVDCAQMGTCAPAPAVVYTQPAPVYSQPAPTYSAPTYAQAAPVNCPAGTTAQSDGTCMQSSSSYSTGSYSSGSTSSYSSSTTYDSTPVSCPAGTTAQPDGTCMQGSSYSGSTSSYSGSTYSAPASSTTLTMPGTFDAAPVNCPAGTTAQSDGTCMQGGSGFTGATVELYQGDASTQSTGSYGYTGGTYNSSDYLPIRK